MKKEYIRLIAIILIILFILISFIIYNQLPLLIGKKIILATNPVDPFDPFRGQYMNINYEISTLENTQKFEINEKVYVILKEVRKRQLKTNSKHLGEYFVFSWLTLLNKTNPPITAKNTVAIE